VLVVGSGQSGCQIAEDLLSAGRQVYLSVSKVGRVPRRYRGRDILEWWRDMGFLDVRVEDLPDPAIRFAAQPQASGIGPLGHNVSFQSLVEQGVVLLGRLEGIDRGRLILGDTVHSVRG
jgi:putative flavoprotein involved in K+ transport